MKKLNLLIWFILSAVAHSVFATSADQLQTIDGRQRNRIPASSSSGGGGSFDTNGNFVVSGAWKFTGATTNASVFITGFMSSSLRKFYYPDGVTSLLDLDSSNIGDVTLSWNTGQIAYSIQQSTPDKAHRRYDASGNLMETLSPTSGHTMVVPSFLNGATNMFGYPTGTTNIFGTASLFGTNSYGDANSIVVFVKNKGKDNVTIFGDDVALYMGNPFGSGYGYIEQSATQLILNNNAAGVISFRKAGVEKVSIGTSTMTVGDNSSYVINYVSVDETRGNGMRVNSGQFSLPPTVSGIATNNSPFLFGSWVNITGGLTNNGGIYTSTLTVTNGATFTGPSTISSATPQNNTLFITSGSGLSNICFQGGIIMPRRIVTANYTNQLGDRIVSYRATTPLTTVTNFLPPTAANTFTNGYMLSIKDGQGSAATTNIVLFGIGGALVDRAASATINANFGAKTLILDAINNNWEIY